MRLWLVPVWIFLYLPITDATQFQLILIGLYLPGSFSILKIKIWLQDFSSSGTDWILGISFKIIDVNMFSESVCALDK